MPPFRIGVMQLTMEPVDEMLATARAARRAGFDTIWLAEAYPWWRKHQMEARSSTVVSALMAAADVAADDRLGDHLAVHAPPGAGGDGRARRAGARAGALHPRLRDVEDLPQQRADADEQDARADARRGRDRARRPRRRGVPLRRRDVERRRSGDERGRAAATCRPSTSPRPRRRCRRSPARSATAA